MFLKIFLFYLFLGCAGSSPVARERGLLSSCPWAGFSLQWLLLLWSKACTAKGLQSLQLADFSVEAQQAWCTGWVAPRHMGSPRTRDRTCGSCTGRWLLHHWATKEPCMCVCVFFLTNFTLSLWVQCCSNLVTSVHPALKPPVAISGPRGLPEWVFAWGSHSCTPCLIGGYCRRLA